MNEKNYPISRNSLELIKWIALAAMTGDHINTYLFNGTLPYLYEAGRISYPLFVFVFVYKLHTYNVNTVQFSLKILARLLLFSFISTIPFEVLHTGSLPLNIFYTFSSIYVCIILYDIGTKLSATVMLLLLSVTGYFVEYGWLGVMLGLSIWIFLRSNNRAYIFLPVLSLASLYYVNGNNWAIASIAIVIVSSLIHVHIKRIRIFFYLYYPLHLSAIALIRIPMASAGYAFFT